MSSQANAKISPSGGPATAALVARAAAGDRDAFATLYNEHHSEVYRYLHYRTRNRDLAEDLAQETFVRALRGIGTFAERSSTGGFAGWLCVIARNLHLDHCKAARTRLEISSSDFFEADDRLDSAEVGALRKLEAVEATETIAVAMRALNPHQRECIELRFLEELTAPETAARMGKGVGAVKTLTFRSMRLMQQALTAEGVAA